MVEGIYDLIDPTLSSVSIASASFPWVTPSLRFSWERAFNEYRDQPSDTSSDDWKTSGPVQKGAVNLVDGGYFENTGAETMSEILDDIISTGDNFLQCDLFSEDIYVGTDNSYRARSFPNGSPCLNTSQKCESIEARYVDGMALGTKWDECEMQFTILTIIIRDTPSDEKTGGPQNFVTDPINAMLNARSARGDLAIATLEERKCKSGAGVSGCWADVDFTEVGPPHPQLWSGIFQSRIDTRAMKLPLGWHMPLDRMQSLEDWVVPSAAVCDEVGIPLFEETELYDFKPSSKHPAKIDLLLKRNCSHQRQIGLMFDVNALKSSFEWQP